MAAQPLLSLWLKDDEAQTDAGMCVCDWQDAQRHSKVIIDMDAFAIIQTIAECLIAQVEHFLEWKW
jgi:hypothetical protein